jgi:hypothetical protein
LFNRAFHPARNAKLRLAHQRFALLALGQAWTLLGSRKNPKPGKSSKIRTLPTRPLHAVLGVIKFSTCSSFKKPDNTYSKAVS